MIVKWLTVLVLVIAGNCWVLPTTTATDCTLAREFIEQIQPLVFIRDFSNIHIFRYKLLSRDVVYPKETIYIGCLGQTTTVSIVSCDGSTGEFSPMLPNTACKPPKAIKKDIDDNTFSIGYEIDFNWKVYLELYRTVYDKNAVSAKYTIYSGYTGNVKLPRPDQQFTLDYVINGTDAKSFTKQSIYKETKHIFGTTQAYVYNATVNVIERGHLAPSADFLFDYDKRATFKYLNVVPQFGEVNRENWKQVEEWVRAIPRKRPRDDHIPYRVVTGVLGVLSLLNENNTLKPYYLIKEKKNPVQRWIYKVVDKLSVCTVFVTYNNIFDKTKQQPPCKVIDCPETIVLKKDPLKGQTYCCEAPSFLSNYLPNADICNQRKKDLDIYYK